MNDQIKNLANEILAIKDKLEYNYSSVLSTYESTINNDNIDLAVKCDIKFSIEFNNLLNSIVSDTAYNAVIDCVFNVDTIKVNFLGGEYHSRLEDKMRDNVINALTPLCRKLLLAINNL